MVPRKIFLSAICMVLVIAATIGSLATVKRSSSKFHISAQKKESAFSSICASTTYKEACERSIKSVSNSSDPKEFIKAALEAASTAITSSFELTKSLSEKPKDPKVKMTVEDCRDLFTYAIQEVQASYSMVGNHEMATISERAIEIRTWLSAILSYSETCTEGVQETEFKSAINDGVVNATQLTSNALAIVTELNKILAEAFNLKLEAKTSRRLMSASEIDREGFPAWLSAADRRLLAAPVNVKPNLVVAQDGSGDHRSINDAIKMVPKDNPNRFVIYVKAGIYKEYVLVQQNNVFMYGDGPRKTIVTGSHSNAGGYSTYQSYTFSARGDGFLCTNMGFQNTAGPDGHMAVALHTQSDMAAFYKCRMDGFQDTLYLHAHRQFFRNCVISGTVDFIFGDSAAVLQNCKIIARKGNKGQYNLVTAQKRKDANEPTGFAIHNCALVPDMALAPVKAEVKTFLGRPWGEYARVVLMESTMGDHIDGEGWKPWSDNRGQDGKVFFAEYGNKGPGAGTAARTKTFKGGVRVISKEEAQKFTVDAFIQGGQWLPGTGFPYIPGLKA